MAIVGQTNILDWIFRTDVSKFSNFIIFCGGRGSGKTLLSKCFADRIGAEFAICGIKVDEIREVIDTAYKARDTIVYCIKDADTMRNEAKNALLKITEEPPKNAYFIMTVEDDSTLLATIKSRANVLYIEPYTPQQLRTYFYDNHREENNNVNLICDIATTPYEVDKMVEYGTEFLDFVELVLDNIAEVEPANAFKSSTRLALKTDEGYDVKLFWNTFVNICMKRLSSNPLKYAEGICTTIHSMAKIGKLGVNKQQVYDDWVFNIREVWL